MQAAIHRTQRIAESIGKLYPQAWPVFDAFRRKVAHAPDWPAWCYAPVSVGFDALTAVRGAPISPRDLDTARRWITLPAIFSALAAWRASPCIYRFDATLLVDLVQTPLDGAIPFEALHRLPHWCVYIELPQQLEAFGVWVHLERDIDGVSELRLLLDHVRDLRNPVADGGLMPLTMPLLPGKSVADCLQALEESALKQARQFGHDFQPNGEYARYTHGVFASLLPLILYLCSDRADIVLGTPASSRQQRGAGRAQHLPADRREPLRYDVGLRIGAALRKAHTERMDTPLSGKGASAQRASPVPHVRRAHWHTFLAGPRLRPDGSPVSPGERRRLVRWVPPVAVGFDWEAGEVVPAVVRPVKD